MARLTVEANAGWHSHGPAYGPAWCLISFPAQPATCPRPTMSRGPRPVAQRPSGRTPGPVPGAGAEPSGSDRLPHMRRSDARPCR